MGEQVQHDGVVVTALGIGLRNCKKVFLPPLFSGLGIYEQAGRIHGSEAGGVIHWIFGSAPVNPFVRAEFKLAG
jgi:hypothetical protein